MSMDGDNPHNRYATFAGGCFWCMAGPFQEISGVLDVKSGYTGGHMENPTYEDVCLGTSGHYEAVQITYNPAKVDYALLLDTYWRQIDPTDPGGQFYDRGQQYQTVIFYHDEEQKELAIASKKELENSGRFNKPIVTEILPARKFYPAEEYHQDYHRKNPERYKNYKNGSGRQEFVCKVWSDKA